ncbi:putative efflux protein, MATE family [Clostridium amylolyticum]|uniref:Probable multidrug resistance protein NorM n=1 Tax=Clostridium amylolyticum TaxID=1121298 RepID=A0A1M6P0F9_9CLOT|nr:MATE family efflux transporter [Clostridium amylolyticum]SHK01362.1 putative efflux protein, MATE family [Clostridium amylolyticum]
MKIHKSTVWDVLRIALPAVGEMILYMMIGVFDTMMVGQYGGNLAVSSVGLSSEIIYTFSNILVSNGISIGVASLVARKIGAGKKELAEEYATLGFLSTAIISIIVWAVLFSTSSIIFRLIGAEEKIVSLASPYMKIASIGIAFNMLMNSLNAGLRGYGNTKTPLIASVIINVVNIFLDYSLIFGKFGMPSLGARGAAIATSIAQVLGFIFIAIYMYKYSKIKVKLKYIKDIDYSMVKSLMKLSIPSSFQEGAFSISRLLSNFFIVSLGSVAFAANQITTSIESISFMPGWGFAVAATTLVGHKIGEKNYKKAKEYAYCSILLATLVMLICSVLFLAIPRTLFSLYIGAGEEKVISEGVLCLMVASIEQPFMAISMVAGGVLKGSGDTKTPFKVSVISSWIVRLPLMFIVIYVLKLSVVYVWIITTIQWIIDGSIIFILFRRRFNEIESL